MVRLDPERCVFIKETDRLLALLGSTVGIIPGHRKVIAEIVLLRLSILLENSSKLVFAKLACGALYLDGSCPTLLVSHRSMGAALAAMSIFNRAKDRHLIWNEGAEIRENVIHLMDASDNCMNVMKTYASHLTEVRYIRNHIAHRNDRSRANFRKVVRKYYGASLPGVTCGTLLLSERVSRPPLLEAYIKTSRVLLNDLVKTSPHAARATSIGRPWSPQKHGVR